MEVAHASEMSMRLHGDTSQISVFFMIMVLQTLTLHATFFIKFLPWQVSNTIILMLIYFAIYIIENS